MIVSNIAVVVETYHTTADPAATNTEYEWTVSHQFHIPFILMTMLLKNNEIQKLPTSTTYNTDLVPLKALVSTLGHLVK